MEMFSKYGTVLISLLSGIMSVVMVMAVFNTTNLGTPIADVAEESLSQEVNADHARVDYVPAVAQLKVRNEILNQGDLFNWKDYVSVSINGETKEEYKEYVIMIGTVDMNKVNVSQEVTFVLNWQGQSISKKATFFVRGGI